MTLINGELKKAKEAYYLETEAPASTVINARSPRRKSYVTPVKITAENVAKVEAMIAHDSAYSRSSDRCSHPDDEWQPAFDAAPAAPDPYKDYPGYRGSSAFWLTLLTEYCKNILKCSDIVWSDLKGGGGFFDNLGITRAIRDDLELGYLEIMDEWKNIFRKKFRKDDEYFRFLIFNSICAIDAENSTRLNSDGVGRIELTERIVKRQRESGDFCELLKNGNKEYELIDILSEKTTRKDNRHHPRNNFSFATKFCHYAAFYIFEDTDYQDNYSIFDSVICAVLCSVYYGVTIGGVKNTAKWSANYVRTLRKKGIPYSRTYGDYQGLIDGIRTASEKATGTKVSRNGLDHLLWYYYKGRGAGLL